MSISLIQKLRAGEPRAVAEWYQEYFPRMVRFFGSKVSNEQDAEELSQEVFIKCLRQLPLFRGQSQLWTWMQAIARHEAADYYRRKYAKKALRALPLGEMVVEVVGEAVARQQQDGAAASTAVETALGQLAKNSREVLMLKYVDDKSVKVIAQELGLTAKAVESLLFRARHEFRQAYVAVA
jgi:RNA polymerase sigma-70 factor (ECF subfamily)